MQRPILVTGVGQRAGLHLARTFLQRGWPLVGTYRRDRPGIAELRESGADLCRCDFYREGDLKSLIEAVRDRYQGLRAIIHNASDWLSEDSGLPSEDVMQRMLTVHVQAPYQLNLALADLLQADEGAPADIIHVGDYVSGRGSRKHIAYAASKAALDNLTLSFAARLAPTVKVNSIAPALLLFNEDDSPEYREKALAKSLLRREGGLDEFQHAVDYLLESDYVTGRILHLDGGRHIA
jgi:dihydromonapterin reductase/dihydrofolate reductase